MNIYANTFRNDRKFYTGLLFVLLCLGIEFPLSNPFLILLPASIVISVAYVSTRFESAFTKFFILTPVVFYVNMNSRVINVGDSSWNELASRANTELFRSSLGAHAILRTLSEYGVNLSLLSPICGTLTFVSILIASTQMHLSKQSVNSLTALAVVVGTLPLFSYGFLEVSQLGFPFAVSSIAVLGGIAGLCSRSWWKLFFSGVFAGIAVALHGIFLILLLGILIKLVLSRMPTHLIAVFLSGVTGVLTAIFLAIVFSNTRTTTGDALGGGDGSIFPPHLFSLGRFSFSIAICMCGTLLALPWLFYLSSRDFKREHLRMAMPLLVFPVFIYFWNLDLGVSRDLDLVYASSAICLWLPDKETSFKLLTPSIIPYLLLAYTPWSLAGWSIF